MSAAVVSLTALRTARLLRANVSPRHIEVFMTQMTELARAHGDAAREAFWREVATMVAHPPARSFPERPRPPAR